MCRDGDHGGPRCREAGAASRTVRMARFCRSRPDAGQLAVRPRLELVSAWMTASRSIDGVVGVRELFAGRAGVSSHATAFVMAAVT